MTKTDSAPSPLITLTTDFGQSDGYVGAMQGVMLNICPPATLVTISHDIPPQNIQAARFVLYQIFSYYPAHVVHCVVIDPGVGSQRRAIAVRTKHGTFVGPDNGVFDLVFSATEVLEAVDLTNRQYQLPQVSATFHGRDIFAPAAAHLATGVPLAELGSPITNLNPQPLGAALDKGQSRVIHVDHFGNLVLDLTIDQITNPEAATFTLGQTVINSVSRTFADAPIGHPLAYVGSTRNHIEIAIRNGNAAQTLGVQAGDGVIVNW